MGKDRLIYCVQCNAVALFSSLDRAPEYVHDQGNWMVIDRDDQDAFIKEHRGHHLEELQPVPGSFVSSQKYIEPVKTAYFEATSGKKRFVVKKFRKSISDPMSYEIVRGSLVVTPQRLQIDGFSIQKQLERILSPFSPQKIRLFVGELRKIVSGLDPKDCKRLPFESHNPSVWYFSLDRSVWEKALELSSTFLARDESRRLDAVIQSTFDRDTLVAFSQVEITVKAGSCSNKDL